MSKKCAAMQGEESGTRCTGSRSAGSIANTVTRWREPADFMLVCSAHLLCFSAILEIYTGKRHA